MSRDASLMSLDVSVISHDVSVVLHDASLIPHNAGAISHDAGLMSHGAGSISHTERVSGRFMIGGTALFNLIDCVKSDSGLAWGISCKRRISAHQY